MKSLERPNCGGTVESQEGKDYFFCIHYSNKIIFEDDVKRIEIKKEILSKKEIVKIDCSIC